MLWSMSTHRSRLSAQHPDVAAAIAALPAGRLGDAVRDVARAAAQACGLLELCEGSSDLDGLVAELDDVAWQAQVADERAGQAGLSYDDVFRRARAAESWRQAAVTTGLDTASDAIYEALHALGGDSEAEVRVVELLNT